MYEELVEKCKEYMEVKSLSQVKLAGKIGVAESTFSRWMNGTYPNPDAITEKVALFFGKAEQREASALPEGIGYAHTTISERVLNVLEYARIQRIIGVVYGDAGIGKTYTCRHWAQGKSDVVMITINPTFASPKSFLKVLARALKTDRAGSSDEVLLDIYDHLTSRDMTIIIDEAQHLTRRTLEVIRSINDATQTTIILVGNESVYAKMLGKQQAEFAQQFSRIAMRSGNLMTDMFQQEDIRMVFRMPESVNEETDFAVDFLLRICRSKYGLRGAVYVYTNAMNNEDVSKNGLKAMADMMGITA